jgi:hypothetical protein
MEKVIDFCAVGTPIEGEPEVVVCHTDVSHDRLCIVSASKEKGSSCARLVSVSEVSADSSGASDTSDGEARPQHLEVRHCSRGPLLPAPPLTAGPCADVPQRDNECDIDLGVGADQELTIECAAWNPSGDYLVRFHDQVHRF